MQASKVAKIISILFVRVLLRDESILLPRLLFFLWTFGATWTLPFHIIRMVFNPFITACTDVDYFGWSPKQPSQFFFVFFLGDGTPTTSYSSNHRFDVLFFCTIKAAAAEAEATDIQWKTKGRRDFVDVEDWRNARLFRSGRDSILIDLRWL